MFFVRLQQILLVSTMVLTCAVAAVAQDSIPELDAKYADLSQAGGTLYRLDPTLSNVRIYAFRGGNAALMGHNHVLSAPHFSGYFYGPADRNLASRFDVVFRLEQLVFDKEEHRLAVGGSFSKPLTDDAIAATRKNMLGEKNFQAELFPLIRLQSIQIVGETPKFAARVAIELHGQTRETWIPLTVTGLPDTLRVEGAWVLRQSDFGIAPFSVLGGLLTIQDEVIIEFVLNGHKQAAASPGVPTRISPLSD